MSRPAFCDLPNFADTPPWFLPRARRRVPPDRRDAHLATTLARRVLKNAHRLHHPDAWLEPVSRHVVYRNPHDDAYVALRVGDTLHYSQVLHMPFVTHDMVYVGAGCVVGLARMSPRYQHMAAITVDRIDQLRVRGKRLFHDPGGGRSPLRRHEVALRALASVGAYKYEAMTFNCQHAYERMLGLPFRSLGAARMTALVTGVVLVFLALVFAVVCVKVNRRR